MMTTQNLVLTLNAVTEKVFNGTPVSFESCHQPIPQYHGKACCRLCTLHKKHPKIRERCTRFYRETLGQTGHSTCPFGVRVYQEIIEVPGIDDRVLRIQCGAQKQERTNVENGLDRLEKKVIRSALVDLKVQPVRDEVVNSRVHDVKQLVASLSMALVGDSIRALGHQLMTPAQGAFADLDRIADGTTSANASRTDTNTPSNRLRSNVEEVVRIAKRLSILLSGELEHENNSLRRVVTHTAVQKIARGLHALADARNIEIRVGYNDYEIALYAVPDQFDLVLSTLLENAVKYSFAGASTGRPRPIGIHFEKSDRHIEICIRNDGVKIDADEILHERLFELNYRGRHSGDRGRRGTGSGLFIARRIADSHSARIEISSTELEPPNKKTMCTNEFRLIWPLYLKE